MRSSQHHHRSQSGESDSGWVSTISEESLSSTRDHGTTEESSTSTQNHFLTDISLFDDDGSGPVGASFLNEDHSHSNWSAGARTCERAADDDKEDEIMSPASVAGAVDEVLKSLQRARQEHASSSSALVGEEALGNASPNGLAQLKHTLRTYNDTGLPTNNVALLRRVEDFHRARFLRRQEQHPFQPRGIFGLFRYLSELQLDLEWAEDAAWRRENELVYLSWADFQPITQKTCRPLYFVYTMTLISSILLLVCFQLSDWKFAPISVNPMLGPNPDVLFQLGALERTSVLEQNEWFRLLSTMFLHAGLIHLALNMLALICIGGAVERRHGTPETILVFLLTAVGGNMASTLFMSPSISVGASGGIFGLLGVCLADVIVNWDLLTLKNYRDVLDPAHKGFPFGCVVFWLTIELFINVLVGLTPYVDQFAHIAGFLLGVGFGIPFLRWLKGPGFFGTNSVRYHCLCGVARFCLFTFTLGAFFIMVLLLLNSDGEPLCESCRYISCVPFPFWKEETWWRCDDCDLTIGKVTSYTPTTIVDLTCPDARVIQVDLQLANVDDMLIQKNLSNYCRQSCFL